MPPQIGSGLGRPCPRSFGPTHPERPTRPVRAAGSRRGVSPRPWPGNYRASTQIIAQGRAGPYGPQRPGISAGLRAACGNPGLIPQAEPGQALSHPATRARSSTTRPPRSASAGAAPVARSAFPAQPPQGRAAKSNTRRPPPPKPFVIPAKAGIQCATAQRRSGFPPSRERRRDGARLATSAV